MVEAGARARCGAGFGRRRLTSVVAALVAAVALAGVSPAFAERGSLERSAVGSRDAAARDVFLFLKAGSKFFKSTFAHDSHLRRPALGVLRFERMGGSAQGRISCVVSGQDRSGKTYGCVWAIAFTRRAKYSGLVIVKFYRPGPNYNIQPLWSKCRALGGSNLCRLHPAPR